MEYAERMIILKEAEEIFQNIITKINKISNSIGEDIFSPDIDDLIKEISQSIPKLQMIISEILSQLSRNEIKPAELEKIIYLSGLATESFEVLENKLKSLADSDAKRIEQLSRIYDQIKSALSFSSRGINIKTKT
jgi:chaperonin cofactor prefoldin